MTARGWSFSKEKPIIPTLQENKNISVIFFTGTGGDLKTHFNIPKIIVTDNIAEELRLWVFENYQASILVSSNVSTNETITHNLEEIKNLIQQKISDDTPPPPTPTPLPNTGMIAQSIGAWEICPCEEGNRIYGKINFIANSSEIWENYYG